MKAVVLPAFAVGDVVDVLIAQPFNWNTREQPDPQWTPGFTVTGIVGAGDRDYRVSVDGPRSYSACAPECVRKAGAA